jgi:uncharacterized membrane protein
MTLTPLLEADWVIQLHTYAAMAAFAIGCVQLAGPKGTGVHRLRGWIWVGLMTVVAATGFGIHELQMFGIWSPIHILSIVVLVTLPYAVLAARRHDVKAHRSATLQLFFLALIGAGAFTFLPGRIMHAVAFGG